MTLLLSGLVVLVLTAGIFWRMLPHDGKLHRWVNTEWEPYIGVAFTSAVALGLTMILAGTLNLIST